MTQEEIIKQLIQQLISIPTVVVVGTVKSVDSETCSVELATGLELPDVQLKQAVNGSDNYLVRSPKVGSTLTAVSLSGDMANTMMLEASEYEFIEYAQDGLLLRIDSTTGKITLKNESTNLYDLFKAIADIISNLTVSTSQGPSGTPLPPTVQAVANFETSFKQLLKQ